MNDTRGEEVDWAASAWTLAATRGGVGFESITSYALSNQTWLIPPAAKLGKLELEPLYLGQRPGLHCSTISRAVADTSPAGRKSTTSRVFQGLTSIRRIRRLPSRIGRARCSLYLTQASTHGIAWS